MNNLRAPFPYFGGKRRVAAEVWRRFGDAPNYVEPFAGSAAVLLARPDSHEWWRRVETINDASGLVSNAWRSIALEPDAVAEAASWPVDECMLHARHSYLTGYRSELVERLEGDPTWCDPQAAGWWVWGASCWIGAGWCAGTGPWQSVDGRLVNGAAGQGEGISRGLCYLHTGGRGVTARTKPVASGAHTSDDDQIREWMDALSARLRRVRIVCGDWSRVCGQSPTVRSAVPVGVFLDPPYSADRSAVYEADSFTVAHEVRAWALQRGDDPRYRIALCGYDGEHDMPDSWECYAWRSRGRGRKNAARERVWFSPHCLRPARQMALLEEDG